MDYPLPKDELVKHAQGKNADYEVLSALKNLPDRKCEIPAGANKKIS